MEEDEKVMSEFQQYRKKPIIIKAKQMDKPFEVKTLEGTMKGKTGDYLVVGIKGERYPVDRSIFEHTYDLIETWAQRFTKIIPSYFLTTKHPSLYNSWILYSDNAVIVNPQLIRQHAN